MTDRIGIIVDGPGDYASIRCRFSDRCKVIKSDGPRGHTVAIDEIVSRSRKQIAMLRAFGCMRVVVVTDFENRGMQYTDFVERFGSCQVG